MRWFHGLILITVSANALAGNAMGTRVPSPEVDNCLHLAAKKYSISYFLVRAIAEQESGFNPQARGVNTNGSVDIGLMQINSSWLPTLARFQIKESDLANACINADVGGWILFNNLKQYFWTWNAVGAYNATSLNKRLNYAVKIHRRLQRYAAGVPPVAPPLVELSETGLSTGAMGVWESANGATFVSQQEALQ